MFFRRTRSAPAEKAPSSFDFASVLERIVNFAAWAGAILFAAWVARSLVRSLAWPLIGDAALFHYVGWRISEGAVPYRNVFDFQFPGTLLTHLLVVKTIGPGDVAWRVFDLGWLAAGCAALWRCLRPFGALPAIVAASMFCTWHLLLGAWETGQRDFCMAVLIMSAVASLARALETERARRGVLVAGLLIGWATMIKPMAAVIALALVPFVLRAARTGQRTRKRVCLEYVLALAVLPTLCFVWVWISGGLPAFIDIVQRYLPSAHLHLEHKSASEIALRWVSSRWSSQLYLSACLALISAALLRALGARIGLLVVAVLYGVFHVAVQRKGWLYHLEPAAISVCALSAVALARPVAGRVIGRRAQIERFGALVLRCAALYLCYSAVHDVYRRIESRGGIGELVTAHRARVESMRADLRAHVPPGGTALVMDWLPGGVEALLRERIPQPTRLTVDFPMFVDPAAPFVNEFRTQFIADLRGQPPDSIIVCRWPHDPGGLRQLETFEELDAFVKESYRLEAERSEYSVFVRERH